MRNKRGEGEGSSIAAVLIVIALFMVLYLLFIPPEDRHEILGIDDKTNSKTTLNNGLELLAESPGVVSASKDFATKHSMPSLSIFVKTEPLIEKLATNLVIKRGLFTKLFPKLTFRTEDLKDTKSATLSFFVKEGSGTLTIKLNGQTVYSEEIEKPEAKVVVVPTNLLREENQLEFSVAYGFFGVNKYNLQNVILKQEFERINAKESRTFTITSGEIASLSRAVLKYTQVCNSQLEIETTQLDIHINNVRQSTQNIKCLTTTQEMDIDKNLLRDGQNTLTFTIEEGDFSFNQMSFETMSQDAKFLSYQFSIAKRDFAKLKGGENIILKLLMPKEGNKKINAKIFVNENEISMNTDTGEFSRDISEYVVEGTNFLRIIPSNTFLINSLKVIME